MDLGEGRVGGWARDAWSDNIHEVPVPGPKLPGSCQLCSGYQQQPPVRGTICFLSPPGPVGIILPPSLVLTHTAQPRGWRVGGQHRGPAGLHGQLTLSGFRVNPTPANLALAGARGQDL